MKFLTSVLIALTIVLALVPGVLIVTYPNWNNYYYCAVATTAVAYACAFGLVAALLWESR